MNCAICKDKLEVDHPNNIYDVNPITYRKAWMHFDCYCMALDDLKDEKSQHTDFDSRYDEYISKFN